jgi:Sulfotransferase domain
VIAPRWHFEVVRPDDVYFVSYPRSGSTWLRYLLTASFYGSGTDPDSVAATVPDIHRSDPQRRPGTGPVWVKSHMPAWERPPEARVVYLVRHGLDATVSYHRYLRQRGRLPASTQLDSFLLVTDPWPCSWSRHVGPWLDVLDKQADSSRSIVVRYEDLITAPLNELARVVTFLGVTITSTTGLDEAVSLATRDRMRADEARSGPGALNHVGAAPASAPDGPGVRAFLEQAAPVLARAGYPTTWPRS